MIALFGFTNGVWHVFGKLNASFEIDAGAAAGILNGSVFFAPNAHSDSLLLAHAEAPFMVSWAWNSQRYLLQRVWIPSPPSFKQVKTWSAAEKHLGCEQSLCGFTAAKGLIFLSKSLACITSSKKDNRNQRGLLPLSKNTGNLFF